MRKEIAGLTRLRSRTVGGGAIVALSGAMVATMVACVASGPLGTAVLARDGYSNRDLYAAADVGSAVEAGGAAARRPLWTPPPRRNMERREARRAPPRRPGEGPVRATARFAARLPAPGGSSVCVRLCDGYYFPVGELRKPGDLGTQTAACADACPGAPTRLFTMRSPEDAIDDALSTTNGQRYGALPMAFAHTAEVGPTCSCHPAGGMLASVDPPLRDVTLRKGDSIMTPVGWRVFRGASHWPYKREDFTTLAGAGLSAKTRSTLKAIENASLGAPGARPQQAAALTVRVSLREPASAVADRSVLPR